MWNVHSSCPLAECTLYITNILYNPELPPNPSVRKFHAHTLARPHSPLVHNTYNKHWLTIKNLMVLIFVAAYLAAKNHEILHHAIVSCSNEPRQHPGVTYYYPDK